MLGKRFSGSSKRALKVPWPVVGSFSEPPGPSPDVGLIALNTPSVGELFTEATPGTPPVNSSWL